MFNYSKFMMKESTENSEKLEIGTIVKIGDITVGIFKSRKLKEGGYNYYGIDEKYPKSNPYKFSKNEVTEILDGTEKKSLKIKELIEQNPKLKIKVGDYITTRGFGNAKLDNKIVKVISIRPEKKRLSVAYDYMSQNFTDLKGKTPINNGFVIEYDNVEEILGKSDPRAEEFEKKLQKLIESIPIKGDYILLKGEYNGMKLEDKVVKVIAPQGNNMYRVKIARALEYFQPGGGRNTSVVDLIDIPVDNIAEKLKVEDEQVKKYNEEEKNYNDNIPKKDDYIELQGSTMINNLKVELKGVIAKVIDVARNPYIKEAQIIQNISLDFGFPIKNLATQNLGGKIETWTGYYLHPYYVKEIIKDKEDPRIKKYFEQKELYLKTIPKKGDFVKITIIGDKIGIVRRVNGNNFNVEVLQYFPAYANIARISDTEVQVGRQYLIKVEDDNEYVKEYKEGNLEVIKTSDKIKPLIPHQIKNIWTDVSYIDVGNDIDEVSFISVKKAKELPEKERWTSTKRQTTKVGRLLNKICGGVSQPELEELTTSYKAMYKMFILKEFPLKFVEGDQLEYWYNEKRYVKGGGSLNNSCMRGAGKQLQFYVDNPGVIRLLVMFTDNGEKVMGRALVWQLVEPAGQYYMDRVYTVNNYDEKIFYNFAESQGWLHYRDQKMKRMAAKVVAKKYDQLPYLDTMRSINDLPNGVIRNY